MAAATYDPLFESAWLKWAQAIAHTQTLEAHIAAWTRHDPDPIRAFRTEYHAKRHGFAVIVEDVAPMPVRWRLLLGDIANNYRAALDHLAWALVSRGRTPPGSGKLTRKQEKAVYLPVCQDRKVFNAEVRVPTGRAPPSCRASAEQMQQSSGRHSRTTVAPPSGRWTRF